MNENKLNSFLETQKNRLKWLENNRKDYNIPLDLEEDQTKVLNVVLNRIHEFVKFCEIGKISLSQVSNVLNLTNDQEIEFTKSLVEKMESIEHQLCNLFAITIKRESIVLEPWFKV